MSYKDVLKIFKLERELSDDETAFLNTLRSMSEAERELLVESLGPRVKVLPKKKRAPRKSAHASSLQQVLKKEDTLREPKEPKCVACYEVEGHANHDLANGGHKFDTNLTARIAKGLARHELCTFSIDGKVCKGTADDGVHDASMGYAAYHEFQPPAAAVGASGD